MLEFLGHEVDFPFGPAAGAINGVNIEEILQKSREILRSPAGSLEIGSICMLRSTGNESYGRTYYHDARTGRTVNSEGLPNVGVETAEDTVVPYLSRLARDQGKPLVVSVSSTKDEDPTKVLPELAERVLLAGATAVETNYSCPSIITSGGGRKPILGFNPEKLALTHDAIAARIGDALWIEKLPPYIEENTFIVSAVLEALGRTRWANYLAISNTIGGISILDDTGKPALDVPGNLGGLSGSATSEVGMQQLQMMRKKIPVEVGIISSLGIKTGKDVLDRKDAGADFTTGVTRYFEGGNYGRTTLEVVHEFDQALEEKLNDS